MSDTFAERAVRALESAVVKRLSEPNWIDIPRPRLEVPRDWLAGVYSALRWDEIRERVLHRIEDRIADKIFNSIATEVGNDAKRVMTNTELREQCRALIREALPTTHQRGEG